MFWIFGAPVCAENCQKCIRESRTWVNRRKLSLIRESGEGEEQYVRDLQFSGFTAPARGENCEKRVIKSNTRWDKTAVYSHYKFPKQLGVRCKVCTNILDFWSPAFG